MIQETHEIAGRMVRTVRPDSSETVDAAIVWLPDVPDALPLDSPELLAELQRHRLAAICPLEPTAFWLDRIVPSFHDEVTPLGWLRNSVLPFLAEAWNIRPPRVGIAGQGWGGQGALRAAYLYPDHYSVTAVVNAAVDFNEIYGAGSELDELFSSAETARQETVTLRLHPLNLPRKQWHACDAESPWYEGDERLLSKLNSIGMGYDRFDMTLTSAPVLPAMMNFLAESLREPISFVRLKTV